MSGAALARAAQALVGTRFRLGGRSAEHGLDCIGVLAVALAATGRDASLPNGYALRLADLGRWLPDPEGLGFAPASPPFAAGDVVLLSPGAAQYHLAIAAEDGGWVHAHAGLKRVVRSPALPEGMVVHHWRPAPSF